VIGPQYECFKHAWTAAVVVAPSSPFFAGTGVKQGTVLPRVMGPEVDRVRLSYPTPRPLQVLMHSPFACPGGPSYGDTTYYTASSGAGVFASGSETWVCAMSRSCRPASTADVIRKITDNVLTIFAKGPAARDVPAQDNAARYAGR
jgi:hypothetical protein